MCDVEWTKVMMEWVVEKGVVNAEEDGSLLCFRSLREETKVESIF